MSIKVSKEKSNITVGLNICAIIMLAFAIFNIYTSNKYISDLILQGFKVSEQLVDVIKFYINAVTPYVFYAISLFVMGLILSKIDMMIYKSSKATEDKIYDQKQKNIDMKENDEDIVEILLKESHC